MINYKNIHIIFEKKIVLLGLIFVANLFTVFVLAHHRVVLDYDGIFFVTLAELIQGNELDHPMLEHRGFLFAYLIQVVGTVSGLDLENSGYLLNSMFLTLISCAFLSIVEQLGGKSKAILALSIGVIILFPSLSKYKSMIIRDFAFIACYLWSIDFLLRYTKTQKNIFLFLWFTALLIGGFFRIESFLYLFIIGLAITTANLRNFKKIISIAMVIKISIVFLVAMFFLLILNSSSLLTVYADYWISYLIKSFQRLYGEIGEKTFLDACQIMIYSFYEVVYESIRRLDFIYFILAVAAYRYRLVLSQKHERNIIFLYVALGLAIVTLFRAKEGFLASRYTLPTVLTVLVLCPFALNSLIEKFKEHSVLKKVLISMLLFSLTFLSLKRFEHSDRYIERVAGEWAKSHLINRQKLISNNSKVLYYANQFPYTKRGNSYYRYETSYMIDEFSGKYMDSEYLALLIDPEFDEDIVLMESFNLKFGSPVKKITSPSTNRRVNIYIIKDQ